MRAENNPKELKIGWATSIEERERNLFQTGMSRPLKAIFHVAVDDPVIPPFLASVRSGVKQRASIFAWA